MTDKNKNSLKNKLKRKTKKVSLGDVDTQKNNSERQLFKDGQSFDLVLSGVKEYDKNPRNAKNPAYDSLYLSIKTRGIRDKLAVTMRPNESIYMLSAGGNTRLAILNRLYEETKDEKYNNVKVFFSEYESEIKLYLDHLSENDDSGDLVFIDRSLAVRELQLLLESDLDKKLTTTELSKLLNQKGYDGAGKSQINDMMYAVDYLEPVIPTLLREHKTKNVKEFGMGSRLVAEIRKIFNQSRKGYLNKSVENEADDWKRIFYKALSKQNKNPALDIEALQISIVKVLAEGDLKKEKEIAEEVFKNKKKQAINNNEASNNEPLVKENKKPSASKDNIEPLNDNLTEKANVIDSEPDDLPDDLKDAREVILASATEITLGSKIEGLVEPFDNGVGYKILNIKKEGLDSHDLSIWWLLFCLSKIVDIPEKFHDKKHSYFSLLEKEKTQSLEFWDEFSNGQLSLEIMTNALSIFIDCVDKPKLKELHKLENQIFQLLNTTNDKIWTDK